MKISLLLTADFYGRLDRRLFVLNTPLIPPAPVLGQQPVYFMRLSYRVYQKRKSDFISFPGFPVPKEYDYFNCRCHKSLYKTDRIRVFLLFFIHPVDFQYLILFVKNTTHSNLLVTFCFDFIRCATDIDSSLEY